MHIVILSNIAYMSAWLDREGDGDRKKEDDLERSGVERDSLLRDSSEAPRLRSPILLSRP